MTVDDIFEQGLHQFILVFTNRSAAIGNAIAEDYRFLA